MNNYNIAKGMCPVCDGLLNFNKEENQYDCLDCNYSILKEDFNYMRMRYPVEHVSEHSDRDTLNFLNNFDK